jgi:hypothetical protein
LINAGHGVSASRNVTGDRTTSRRIHPAMDAAPTTPDDRANLSPPLS